MSTETPVSTEHAERPHAERSASQLGNLALCEGYRPRNNAKKHWVTAQGQRGHEALDEGDSGDLESTFEERMVALCEEYVSKLPEAVEDLKEIKVDTICDRWGYVDRLRFRKDGAKEEGVRGVPYVTGTACGYAMRANYVASVADLLDWKFVRSKEVTDAEVNLQGKDYTVGVFERYPALETIHVHFVMPRFNSVTTATFHRSDVPQLKLEIYAVLRKAQRSDKGGYRGNTLTPHFDVCRYCGAAGNCKKLRQIADELGRKYDPEGYGKLPPVPDNTHASQVKDPAQRAQLQTLAAIAEEFAKSVRYNNLTAAMENPANIPSGYKIDYRKGKRRVTSAPALLLVAQEFGLNADDLIDCASLSWTRVEEKIKEKAGRGEKAGAVTKFNQRLLELDAIERPEDTPTLVRVSK